MAENNGKTSNGCTWYWSHIQGDEQSTLGGLARVECSDQTHLVLDELIGLEMEV